MAIPAERSWIRLCDQAEGLVIAGRIVAVIFAQDTGSTGEGRVHAWEFCWVPVDEPAAEEVLWGLGDAAGGSWDKRWEHAQATAEMLYAEWLEKPD
jgi:hypothetical protein